MAKKSRKKKSKKEKRVYSKIGGFILLTAFFGSIAGSVYFTFNKIDLFFVTVLESFCKHAGLKIESIRITGAKHSVENSIKKQINVNFGDSIFKLSSGNIYSNVMKIGSIQSATVRKNLPNTLSINVTEKTPIAIFQKNSKFVLIDKDGITISETRARTKNLPIITGDNANTTANSMLEIVSKFEIVKNKLDSMMFVRKRRWDIIVSGGIHVKLPQYNIERALEVLSEILKQRTLNKNTVKSIDLRMPENIVISGLKIKDTKKKTSV